MGDKRGGYHITPRVERRGPEVGQNDRRDPHERPVPRARYPGLVPGLPFLLALAEERADRASDPEDAPRGEGGCQILRIESALLKQGFHGPEGELGVVGGNADATAVGMSVRRIVPDLTVLGEPVRGQHALRGVPERIADRQAQQHSPDSVLKGRRAAWAEPRRPWWYGNGEVPPRPKMPVFDRRWMAGRARRRIRPPRAARSILG